jgi:hypothetical protein
MGRRILFVGMQASIHVARWIELVADKGWDLHFFPVDADPPNQTLRGVTLHWPVFESALERVLQPIAADRGLRQPLSVARRLGRLGRLTLRDPREAWRRLEARLMAARGANNLKPGASGVTVTSAAEQGTSARSISAARNETAVGRALHWSRFSPTLAELGGAAVLEAGSVRLGESDSAAPVLNGPGVLAGRIRALRPDLIHSMEFQHAGYLVLRARELHGPGFPTWLATNWGSDIFYFGRFADHRAQIERLLASIDFYSCECQRDVAIARQYGYGGPVLSGVPNSGGFDLKRIASLRSSLPPSRRKLVMVKGYQHFAGRALTALQVLETFASQLNSYRIVLFSTGEAPRKRARELKQAGVLDIEAIDWGVPHEQILTLLGEARLYMGISISDAISTSVLEAMAMGAFPIQTNTSCCDEWFTDGQGGFIVPHDNLEVICNKFGRALADDALVDRAAEVNWQTVQTRLDKNIIAPKVVEFYDRIFTERETNTFDLGIPRE